AAARFLLPGAARGHDARPERVAPALVGFRSLHTARGRAVGAAFQPFTVTARRVVEENHVLEFGLGVLRLELPDGHPESPCKRLSLSRRDDHDAALARTAVPAAL